MCKFVINQITEPMIKIFPTDKIKALDQYTIDHEPIRSIELVERAAMSFVNEYIRTHSKQIRTVIFAGQGNNGADALAIARLLNEEGFRVETYLFNPGKHLSLDCELNRQRLLNMENIDFIEIVTDFDPPELGFHDVVIDGLFGSGLNRPLTGGFAALVNYINQSDATIVSIDIPSGLFGEDNRSNDRSAIIQADMTYTFEFPKLAFFFAENDAFVGKWKVLPIGLHPQGVAEMDTHFAMMTEDDIAETFPPRDRFGHKGSYGHALLIGGSMGKMGAAVLAARGCLRSGVGMLTAHLPKRGEVIMQIGQPEVMLSFDQHTDYFTSVPETMTYKAVAVGPGLGQQMETGKALERLLQTQTQPMVIDADALNLIASNKETLTHLPKNSILTPHPKEFDRIAGESSNSYDRLLKAMKLATEYEIFVVLKGAYTVICTPDGNALFNSTGNPGMGTAGSGDVLTGIILGLLAQGLAPEIAAVSGVFIHGSAGDLAAAYRSEEGIIASDIADMVGKAIKQLK